ncbi:hypothetical protein I7I53_01502 [Histoplasma capsulatum var. duboisii H88]|uniref:Uncharacterized protein n=1 Tax=Ajellomyces capsulatus (strain H88) TaxID=544711 RepID=A0A8A1LI44_AJEC8|nr:hypothetical protein I7I53_01502 [Histoplasma capsulatum var. duboisii H88]
MCGKRRRSGVSETSFFVEAHESQDNAFPSVIGRLRRFNSQCYSGSLREGFVDTAISHGRAFYRNTVRGGISRDFFSFSFFFFYFFLFSFPYLPPGGCVLFNPKWGKL